METALLEAGLTDAQGELVPLQHVAFAIRVKDGIAEVNAEQTYRHAGTEPLEVVYTFPVPNTAVLLNLNVKVSGKSYTGQVVEKSEAEADYESAIESGDFALLVEQARQGLYTVSLGVLRPDETVTVRLSWGMHLAWTGSIAELRLPTTVSNPYRDADKSDLMPHQQIVHDAFVELEYSLRCTVTGELAKAEPQCLSHDIAVRTVECSLEIEMTDKCAALDRDFVLQFFSENLQQAQASWYMDGDQYLGWLQFPVDREWCGEYSDTQTARCLELFVDGSMVMAGLAMRHVQAFARLIVHGLAAEERFNIHIIKQEIVSLFSEVRHATDDALVEAERFINKWRNLSPGEADYELMLDCISGRTPAPQVMLVANDGMNILNAYKSRGSQQLPPIDVVGVGSAPTEFSLRALAQRSGGRYAVFGSKMSNAKAADNLGLPAMALGEIIWPQPPTVIANNDSGRTRLAGEIVNLYAWFKSFPEGDIYINTSCVDGPGQRVRLATWHAGDTAAQSLIDEANGTHVPEVRMAVNALIAEKVDEEQCKQMAIDYQLMSRWTNYVLRVERDSGCTGDDMPTLRKVPHMHAAGKAGFGAVEDMQTRIQLKLKRSASRSADANLAEPSLDSDSSALESVESQSIVVDQEASIPASVESSDDAAAQDSIKQGKIPMTKTDKSQTVMKGLGGVAVVMLAAILLRGLYTEFDHLDVGPDKPGTTQVPDGVESPRGQTPGDNGGDLIPGQQRGAGFGLPQGKNVNNVAGKLSNEAQHRLYNDAVSDLKNQETVENARQKFRRLMRQNPNYLPAPVALYRTIQREADELYESVRFEYEYENGELKRQLASDEVIQKLLKPLVPALDTFDDEYQAITELRSQGDYLEASKRYLRLLQHHPEFKPESVRVFQRLQQMYTQPD